MTQLGTLPEFQITVHVRQPDKPWQVYETTDAQGCLNAEAISVLYKQTQKLFPNQRIFIRIQQNV